ncbi:nucleotidyltransferase [Bacillus mycoides]|uniref:nucleotidyltransferase n=1 Tax=Bacillus mycoides TaxID=1405 RepID=UPI0020788F29|nr:nucleotidyltransferase [Bacillus mycoides]
MSTITMHNLNAEFTSFYEEYVRLSEGEINSLREKKRLNVDRLKEGLKEYNDEHGTDYKVVEDIEQGSVAMRTVTQHDKKEYDIDIAVVFDKSSIPEKTKDIKAIVEDALQRKCSRFKASPVAKTNAVTVDYASGYHIDFAVYRRTPNLYGEGYLYEHGGSEWRERDPRAIKEWFKGANDASDNNIRKVVRLLKVFCKSNPGWLMPGGLVQSILIAEKIQCKDRLDETFYETIKAIKERLDYDKEVYNPTLPLHSILYNEKDKQKVKNLCTRLENGLKKLEVLFDENCTSEKAKNAWKEFFNHSFWGEDIQKSFAQNLSESKSEQLLKLKVDVMVNNRLRVPLNEFEGRLPKGCSLLFSVDPLVKFTRVEWTVNNYGDEAEAHKYHKQDGRVVKETTLYRGNHTMTCKLYEGDRIIAQKIIPINIR